MVIGFGSSEELFVLYCQLSNIYMLWLVGIRQRWNLNPYVHGNHRVAIIFIYVCVEKLSVEDMRILGFNDVTALKDEGIEFGGISLFRVEALHGHGIRADYYYNERGLPSEASGIMFTAAAEKTFYIAGDTIWYEGIKKNIERFHPETIAINAANAQFYDGTPILMGLDGFHEVAKAAPEATLIATHMDAVNHARVTRADLKAFVDEKKIAHRVYIPKDGEKIILL